MKTENSTCARRFKIKCEHVSLFSSVSTRTLTIPAKSIIIMAEKNTKMSAIATRVINQAILISNKHAYWHVNENFQRSDPCAVMRNGTLILMSGSVITHVCPGQAPAITGADSRSTLSSMVLTRKGICRTGRVRDMHSRCVRLCERVFTTL